MIGICRFGGVMSPADFASWGWRIPFLVSLILLVFSVYIRLKLNESPVFQKMKAEGKGSKSPLTDSFLKYPNNKYVLLALLGATAGQGVVWYTGQFYALFFLLITLKVDFLTTSNFLTMADLQDLAKAKKINYLDSVAFGEVSYNMLNNAVAPFNNKNCRLAAAYGYDVDTTIKLRAPGATRADGPFAPGSLGYLPDSGYPKFDLNKAKDFFAKCKAELGGGDVKFTLGTTTVPDNIQTAAVQKQMFEAVGFKVDTVNIEQQKYIGVGLVGAFQMFQWRSHGGFDPDQQRVWWHSEMIAKDAAGKPLFDGKTISINFARVNDATVDSAFDQIRGNSDPAVRKKAAENINQSFADNAYDLWGWRTKWALAACAKCGGFTDQKTPIVGDAAPNIPGGLLADVGQLTKG